MPVTIPGILGPSLYVPDTMTIFDSGEPSWNRVCTLQLLSH